MRLYIEIFKLLVRKIVLRRTNGEVLRDFAKRMGIVYIKIAQMLAMQNFGALFTETDRQVLSSICDDCTPIAFDEIERILMREYGEEMRKIFRSIERKPVGSASVSQVHRATLCTGEQVAIKIKRPDVATMIKKDVERIRKLTHRFGWLVKFQNYTGSDRALDLYLEWIEQEIDFQHERENMHFYQEFANNVNGRIPGTKKIRIPKVYTEYCTENIIVMEFVEAQTINKMELIAENKRKVTEAMNNYIKLSFWAMLHDERVVFHGDPHAGNICIDENGDIWFLDMGLLYVMSREDTELCRNFFFAAYAGKRDKLYEMLVRYGDMDAKKQVEFREDCEKYCREVKKKEVTFYFVDMVNICLKYEFVSPDFLFNMAKAFVCLNGINKFVENEIVARDLLRDQVAEFMIKRSFEDSKRIIGEGLSFLPRVLSNSIQQGLSRALANELTEKRMTRSLRESLDNLVEMADLLGW